MADVLNLTDGSKCARGEELELWIVEKIDTRKACVSQVNDADHEHLPVKFVHHMVGPERFWKYPFVLHLPELVQVFFEVRQACISGVLGIVERRLAKEAIVAGLGFLLLVVDRDFVLLPDLEAVVVEDSSS